MDTIISKDNDKIKQAAKLFDSKERRKTGRFCFEGVHLLEEYLKTGRKPVGVFVREDVYDKYSSVLSPLNNGTVFKVAQSVYGKLSSEQAPQGILSVCSCDMQMNAAPPLCGGVIILEDLRDPGNAGTIIRTAVSMGIDKIVMSAGCVDIYNHKLIRGTMGALFSADVYIIESVPSYVQALNENGLRVFAAVLDAQAKALGSFPLTGNDSFVIGNEGAGITPQTVDACKRTVFIPMSGKTESLNAAVAASIILWEMSKVQ